MNEQDTTVSVSGSAESGEMSFAQRLGGIYFEPRRTFESINRRPTWLGMFLIVAALGVGVTYTLMSRMDYQTYMRKALKMNPMTRNMTPEQVQAVLERPQSSVQRYLQLGGAPVSMLIVYLILAGVFMLAFMLTGGGVSYKKSLAVSLWGMGPPAIVVTLLSIVFMMVKDPETLDINPAGNVVSNLGLLVSSLEHPKLASLLSSIDVFSFWTIFLLALGFSTCSQGKVSTGKAAVPIVVLWLLYVAGKVLLAG
jgi:hypothetical protein